MPSFLFGNDSQDKANAAADKMASMSKEMWNQYKETYLPLEQNIVEESRKWETPERYAKAAGEASADVSEAFGKARSRLDRTPGLDPSSGAYQSALTGLNLSQAANDATAQNAARNTIQNNALTVKTNALGLGKNLQAQSLEGYKGAGGIYSNMAGLQDDQNNRLAGAIGSGVGSVAGAFGL
jgi:hypothetical protein